MPDKLKHKGRWIAAASALIVTMVASLIAIYRPDRAIQVATASVSQLMCEQVFISGLNPQRVYDEEVQPKSALRPLLKRLRYEIIAHNREVVTSWAGHFSSVARYRNDYGCLAHVVGAQVKPSDVRDVLASSTPSFAQAGHTTLAVPSNSPALHVALDRAFAEPSKPPYKHVRAIVVMHNGKIVAERYAPGVGPETPLLGYSVSKSVVNALVGILVREGKLRVTDRAPVAAWNKVDDPRQAITLDQLLRMTSGLELTEDGSGFDPVSRMLFLHHDDMATYAEKAALKARPGTTWEYTSGNTLIVSAIVRNAIGDTASEVQRFAQSKLFAPLGMRHVTMELDGAGTPVGSTRMLASARDWARFGQLYLSDGVVDGKRILPEGWVRYSATPTLDSDYGAGFWVNAGDAEDARWRVRNGMPKDTFFASGLYGQRIVIVPSKHLVIVRFGSTIDPPEYDIRGLERLTADVIAAEQATHSPSL